MPTAIDLDQALGMLSNAKKDLADAEAAAQKLSDAEQVARRAVAQQEQECRTLSCGLIYERNIEAYEEALDAADAYLTVLTGVSQTATELHSTLQMVTDTEDSIADQRDQLDVQQKANRNAKLLIERTEAAIQGIQAILDRPENRERAKRLEELAQEIKSQEERAFAERLYKK